MIPAGKKVVPEQLYWVVKPLLLYIGKAKSPFDAWEVFMYLLLLVGSIVFFVKKGKDTRLIAFVFSVILFSNITGIIGIVYYFVYIRQHLDPEQLLYKASYLDYLYPVVGIAYIFISFIVVKTIKKTKVLDITQTEISTSIKDTPKWQRFSHFLIDTVLMLLIFCPLFMRIFETYLIKNETFMTFMNNQFTLLFIIFICRLIYYPFFEIIFGSTPAKLLTESRVVNHVGEKPVAGNIFERTLSRSIPFDSVSFFWKRGWHDSLSHTHVVKEKRIGFKTSYLLFVLLAFIPYLSFYYYGDDILEKYNTYQNNKMQDEYLRQFNKNSIEDINTDQAFVLSPLGSMEYKVFVLKVEKVEGDKIICKKLIDYDNYSTNYYNIKRIYKEQKDSAQTLVFSKKDFEKAMPENLDDSKRNGVNFFNDGVKYQILDIYMLNSPLLRSASFERQGTFSSNYDPAIKGIYIINDGKSGKVISVKTLEGNVKWTDRFPLEIKDSKLDNNFFLNAENIKRNEKFSAEIAVKDSLNHEQIYRIHMKIKPYTELLLFRLK